MNADSMNVDQIVTVAVAALAAIGVVTSGYFVMRAQRRKEQREVQVDTVEAAMSLMMPLKNRVEELEFVTRTLKEENAEFQTMCATFTIRIRHLEQNNKSLIDMSIRLIKQLQAHELNPCVSIEELEQLRNGGD